MKSKRILIAACLITSLSLMSGCTIELWPERPANSKNTTAVYASELNPKEHELVTDHRFKSLDNEDPVRFETAVTAEEAQNGTPVNLCDNNGKSISKMYDDGTHSDRIAGDGIYTCSYKPKVSDEASFSYSAQIGDFWTDPASVRYFDDITDQDVENMNHIGEKFLEIQSEYLDENGYIPEEKKEEAIESIGEYAKQLYNSGEAVEYRVNPQYNNVITKLSSGITMVYDTPAEGFEVGGSGENNNDNGDAVGTEYEIHNLTVKGFRPYRYSYPKIGNNLEDVINNITSTFSSDITSGGIVDSSDVGPHCIDSFGPDQVILWRGHGGYDGSIHAFLGTTRLFNASEYSNDDIIEDRLLVSVQVNGTVAQKGKSGQVVTDADRNPALYPVYITSEYVNAHCPDMTGSMVYLGCCLGAKDSVLAASFLNKNCNVVFGFSESVWSSYSNDFLPEMIYEMCSLDRAYLDQYHTISEAIIITQDLIGENDTVYYGTGNDPDNPKAPAYPILFGNRDYRFADAIRGEVSSPAPDFSVRGDLTLTKEYYSVTVGSSVYITVASYPKDYDKLYWSIDNSDIATITQNGIVKGKKAGTTLGHVTTADGLYYKQFSVVVK